MAWKIEFERSAQRDLAALDAPAIRRIERFLVERAAVMKNPRQLARPLTGADFAKLWRYRVGDYRIIARMEDETLTILVVRVGHRREVYR